MYTPEGRAHAAHIAAGPPKCLVYLNTHFQIAETVQVVQVLDLLGEGGFQLVQLVRVVSKPELDELIGQMEYTTSVCPLTSISWETQTK